MRPAGRREQMVDRVRVIAQHAPLPHAEPASLGDDDAPASIIEFVADARARYPRTGEAVPAEDAEAVIRAALGEDDLVERLDGHAYGAAQTAMLFALTRDEDVEELLSDAAAQGEDYLQRRAGR